MEDLISIIVPVYGTEKYLSRCLDSLTGQSYKNLEIICVNDCSPDGSAEILKRYADKDSRIQVVRHDKNRGLFRARLSGLEIAQGKYIAFLDSDDFVTCDYYRTMYRKAEETGADIVVGDWFFRNEDGTCEFPTYDQTRLADLDLSGEECWDAFLSQHGVCFSWHTVWNKLIRKSLIDLCVPDYKSFSDAHDGHTMCEDIVYSSALWARAHRVVSSHGNNVYYYCQHEGQSVEVGDFDSFSKKIRDVKAAFEFFESQLDQTEKTEKRLKDFVTYRSYYARVWYGAAKQIGTEKAIKLFRECFPEEAETGMSREDAFWFKERTRVSPSFQWFNDMKMTILSASIQVVSFDIFDTLLVRPFWEPSDMFVLMNGPFNDLLGGATELQFKEVRLRSEGGCRKEEGIHHPSNEDITLDQIYSYMEKIYGLPHTICQKMKELELELEYKFCRTRKTGKELFDIALYAGKRVVMISDMYLSKEFIGRLLDKNGFKGYEELFVSSECKKLKYSGNLYRYAFKKLEVRPEQILHIGDSWSKDVEVPRKLGMIAGSLSSVKEMMKGENGGIYSGASFKKIFGYCGGMYDLKSDLDSYLGLRCMLAVVAIRLFDNPVVHYNGETDFNNDPNVIGYYLLGMHLYAVADWLRKKAKSYNSIHFIARDGWLPKQAYEILTKNGGYPAAKYLLISRKATLPLQIARPLDIHTIGNTVNLYRMTPEKVLILLHPLLDEKAFGKRKVICEEAHYGMDTKFVSEMEWTEFLKFVSENFLKPSAIATYRKHVGNYLKEKIGDNDAFFDLGYRGRNEEMFSRLLGRKFKSFYIHANTESADEKAKRNGFEIETFYDWKPSACVVIREHLFCAQEASCTGYAVLPDGKIEEKFGGYEENDAMKFITTRIQQSALQFVSDFSSAFAEYEGEMRYRRTTVSMPYEFYLHYSNPADRELFSEFVFEDDVWGGGVSRVLDFWNENTKEFNLDGRYVSSGENRVIYVSKEKSREEFYDEILAGKKRWKRALFYFLFDRKTFHEKMKKHRKRKNKNEQ